MTKKTNICIIAQYFLPDIHGDIIRLLNVLNSLRNKGFNITLLTAVPHYPSGKIPMKYQRKKIFRERWNGINIIRVPIIPISHEGFLKRLLLFSSFALFSISSLFLIDKVDLVWTFSPRVFTSMPGALLKFFKKAILVTDMSDIWPHAIVNTGYLKTKSLLFSLVSTLFFFIFRVSDYILTLTEAMSSLITSHWRTPKNKVYILPNSIDTNMFIPMEIKKFKELEGKFVIMYSGNLGSNYNFYTILKCAKELRHRDDIVFLIRGEGEMKKAILNYIKKNRLNNVALDNRILDRKELVKYLNMADVYMLPMKKCEYPNASLPIKLLDYIACGKPVLCCAEGYISKLISKYKAGISVPPNDLNGLVNAILSLKENEELRKRMGKNARELALRFFSYDVFQEKITHLFTKIIL